MAVSKGFEPLVVDRQSTVLAINTTRPCLNVVQGVGVEPTQPKRGVYSALISPHNQCPCEVFKRRQGSSSVNPAQETHIVLLDEEQEFES